MQPLSGLLVLDFTTLLPGPLASLLLAEAGATVIKIERPGGGDEMRGYQPRFGADSANFALLNRGKHSVAIDLKAADAPARLAPLLARADVLIEQFRPGVMERLGLGYAALAARHPRLIYCSITGFGQDGPRARFAGHDLNYLALSGLLGLARGADGTPALPPTSPPTIAPDDASQRSSTTTDASSPVNGSTEGDCVTTKPTPSRPQAFAASARVRPVLPTTRSP